MRRRAQDSRTFCRLSVESTVANDPPSQGKKDDDATTSAVTTAAATTLASSASKPKAKNFTAKLRGANENPPVTTNGVGRAKLRIQQDGDLNWFVNASNIANVLVAHIHCGAPNQSGPVVVNLYTGPTIASQSGRLAKGTVPKGNLTPVSSATCPASGGGAIDIPDDADDIVDSLDDLVWLMRNGYAYVNVHTTADPAGEIRGSDQAARPEELTTSARRDGAEAGAGPPRPFCARNAWSPLATRRA